MKERAIKLNKKLLIIIVLAVIVLTAAGTSVYLFLPIKIDVDISSIQRVGTDVEVRPSDGARPAALYKPDGDGGISAEPFKIVAFTDTHLDTYRKKGKFTMEYLIANIQREKPDLTVFVGDLVTSSNNRPRVIQLCEVMEKLGVYWITVLGNHEGDNWQSIPRSEFVDIYSSYAHCLIEKEEKTTASGEKVWGLGNTQLDILTADGAVAQSLFFLDSGDRVSKDDVKRLGVTKDSYDYIKPSQIQWYTERASALDDGVKSMLFLHIPLCEYKYAADTVPKKSDGSFNYGVSSFAGTTALYGSRLEKVSCSEYNSGLFEAVLECGSTQTVVCGHDHVNTFRILYQGVTLCYNRCSGYSSYNAVTRGLADNLEQGASVYMIFPNGEIGYGNILNRDFFDTTAVRKLYK